MLINVTVNVQGFPSQTGELSALATQFAIPGFDPIYIRLKELAGTCPAVNPNGQNFTADQSCGIAGGSPSATTLAATAITTNGATLNGLVNANSNTTTVTFEYGLTTAYGSTVNAVPSSVTGSANTNVAATITGLTPNSTYNFRVVGSSTAGTANGNNLTFTTLAPGGACTPNTAQTTPFEPEPEDLQCAIKGAPFSETIYLNLSAVAALIPFDSVRIDSIGNLPQGIISLPNKSSKTYRNNEFGCLQFSGTSNAACGQYRVKMFITIWGTPASPFAPLSGELGGLAQAFSLPIPIYFLRLASCEGACADFDETAGDFEPNPNCPTPGVITPPVITGSNSFCAGKSTQLSVQQDYLTYRWSNQVMNKSTVVSSAGNYTVTVSNGCDTSTASVSVIQLPSPNVNATQSGNTLSVPATTGASYQWLNNGVPVPNATGTSFTPTVSGNYSVDVTLGNCRDTSSTLQVTISSIEDVTGVTHFNLSPNPAKNYLSVELKAVSEITELKLMDMFGKQLKEIPVSGNYVREKISVEDLPSGIYFLQIATAKGKATHSFIKQ